MDKMVKEYYILILNLNHDYEKANSICDPIEFQKRQQNLLYSIAEVLLYDFEIKEEEHENAT